MQRTGLTTLFFLFVSFSQIPLSAQVPPAALTFSPAALVFPATPLGKVSAEQVVKIKNCVGCAPAIFSDLYYPSNFALDWKPPTVTPACSQALDGVDQLHPGVLVANLGPGAECALGITFNPTTAPVTIVPFFSSLTIPNRPPATDPNYQVDASSLAIDLMCPTCNGFLYKLGLSVAGSALTISDISGSLTQGDPIATATGEYLENTTYLSAGGPLWLRLVRYYASYLKSNGVTGTLGNNWMHNFDVKVTATATTATVRLFQGKTVSFTQSGGTWQLAQPKYLPYQLVNAAGGGYRFLDPGEKLIFNFASNGALSRIEDRNGNALTVSQSASNPGPDQVSDGLGRTLSFTYTAGKLTRVQDQAGRSVSFTYTGDDLTGATDPTGQTTTYTYTTAGSQVGLLTAKSLPNPVTQTLDANGRVIKQSDGGGNSIALAYDQPAGTTSITDALSAVFKHVYQGTTVTGYIDPAGQGVVFNSDENSRRTSLTDRLGDQVKFTYDPASGYSTSYTDATGNVTKYTYTAQMQGPAGAQFTFYNLTRIDYPDGTSVSNTYDAAGNVLTTTDQAGKVWTYTYNPRGQVLTAKNPGGGVTILTYNPDGTLATLQYASGGVIAFAYDNKKRMSKITYPDGATRSFVYNDHDDVIQDTDEAGVTRSVSYNGMHRISSVTDSQGNTASLSWSDAQHPSSFTAPSGKTASTDFNPAGGLKKGTYPTGEPANFSLDANGRLNGIADCSGKGFSVQYDKEGVISSLTDGLSRSWAVETNKQGRTTRIGDPSSGSFQYGYDKSGRLISFTNPLAKVTAYIRDALGSITGVTLPGGVAASFQRNALGQVFRVTDANGNNWLRTYDPQGLLVGSTDSLGQAASYKYDSRNRVSSISWPGGTVNFTYDSAGNLIRKLYSDGLDLKFSYDGGHHVASADGMTLVYNALGSIVGSNGLAIKRDDSNRIVSITYADGKTVNYVYDCRGLVIPSRGLEWGNDSTQLRRCPSARLHQPTQRRRDKFQLRRGRTRVGNHGEQQQRALVDRVATGRGGADHFGRPRRTASRQPSPRYQQL